MQKTWWKESVVYQIYPRSFKDSDGDGIGDLPGIISKLDYIKSLGVDIIWVCPIYQSPNDDNGYDISDYRNIMDEFGTMNDFDKLLGGVHQRGMKLIMDLVPNHTSDEHYWFQESRKSKDNPYRDYYYWKKSEDNEPPTNWPGFFGGSTWELDETTGEYYLHLFSKKQPDLNWENPKVRQEMHDVIKFWLDKGIDGFRMDVVSLISKRQEFANADTNDFNQIINQYYANGPRIHEFINEINQKVLSHYDIMTVGEGPGIDKNNASLYVGEERDELNMIFHFGHMYMDNGPGGKYDPQPFDLMDFKNVFIEWDRALENKGWGSVFLGNHDFSRMVSRFGDSEKYWTESAKLLATLLFTMRGTVYVYQGDEIGMTNVAFNSIEDYRDIETLNSWKEAEEQGKDMDHFMELVHMQSRDNARTPIQWDATQYAGFSSNKPWIGVNDNYININVATQENDPNSILNYYRQLIRFRKENPVLVYGDFKPLDEKNNKLFAYTRTDSDKEYLIIHNFSDEHLSFDVSVDSEFEEVLTNQSLKSKWRDLAPWQSKILKGIK